MADAGIGHNSGTVACDELRQLVERVERVDEDIKALRDDRKDIFLEVKSRGYDPKTVRAILQIRKMGTDEYLEQRGLLDTYLAAFGIGDDD